MQKSSIKDYLFRIYFDLMKYSPRSIFLFFFLFLIEISQMIIMCDIIFPSTISFGVNFQAYLPFYFLNPALYLEYWNYLLWVKGGSTNSTNSQSNTTYTIYLYSTNTTLNTPSINNSTSAISSSYNLTDHISIIIQNYLIGETTNNLTSNLTDASFYNYYYSTNLFNTDIILYTFIISLTIIFSIFTFLIFTNQNISCFLSTIILLFKYFISLSLYLFNKTLLLGCFIILCNYSIIPILVVLTLDASNFNQLYFVFSSLILTFVILFASNFNVYFNQCYSRIGLRYTSESSNSQTKFDIFNNNMSISTAINNFTYTRISRKIELASLGLKINLAILINMRKIQESFKYPQYKAIFSIICLILFYIYIHSEWSLYNQRGESKDFKLNSSNFLEKLKFYIILFMFSHISTKIFSFVFSFLSSCIFKDNYLNYPTNNSNESANITLIFLILEYIFTFVLTFSTIYFTEKRMNNQVEIRFIDFNNFDEILKMLIRNSSFLLDFEDEDGIAHNHSGWENLYLFIKKMLRNHSLKCLNFSQNNIDSSQIKCMFCKAFTNFNSSSTNSRYYSLHFLKEYLEFIKNFNDNNIYNTNYMVNFNSNTNNLFTILKIILYYAVDKNVNRVSYHIYKQISNTKNIPLHLDKESTHFFFLISFLKRKVNDHIVSDTANSSQTTLLNIIFLKHIKLTKLFTDTLQLCQTFCENMNTANSISQRTRSLDSFGQTFGRNYEEIYNELSFNIDARSDKLSGISNASRKINIVQFKSHDPNSYIRFLWIFYNIFRQKDFEHEIVGMDIIQMMNECFRKQFYFLIQIVNGGNSSKKASLLIKSVPKFFIESFGLTKEDLIDKDIEIIFSEKERRKERAKIVEMLMKINVFDETNSPSLYNNLENWGQFTVADKEKNEFTVDLSFHLMPCITNSNGNYNHDNYPYLLCYMKPEKKIHIPKKKVVNVLDEEKGGNEINIDVNSPILEPYKSNPMNIEAISSSASLPSISSLFTMSNRNSKKIQSNAKQKLNFMALIIILFNVFLLVLCVGFLIFINSSSTNLKNIFSTLKSFRIISSAYLDSVAHVVNMCILGNYTRNWENNNLEKIYNTSSLYPFDFESYFQNDYQNVANSFFPALETAVNNINNYIDAKFISNYINTDIGFLQLNGNIEKGPFLSMLKLVTNNQFILSHLPTYFTHIPFIDLNIKKSQTQFASITDGQANIIKVIYNFRVLDKWFHNGNNNIQKYFDDAFLGFKIYIYIIFAVFIILQILSLLLIFYDIRVFFVKISEVVEDINNISNDELNLLWKKFEMIKNVLDLDDKPSRVVKKIQLQNDNWQRLNKGKNKSNKNNENEEKSLTANTNSNSIIVVSHLKIFFKIIKITFSLYFIYIFYTIFIFISLSTYTHNITAAETYNLRILQLERISNSYYIYTKFSMIYNSTDNMYNDNIVYSYPTQGHSAIDDLVKMVKNEAVLSPIRDLKSNTFVGSGMCNFIIQSEVNRISTTTNFNVIPKNTTSNTATDNSKLIYTIQEAILAIQKVCTVDNIILSDLLTLFSDFLSNTREMFLVFSGSNRDYTNIANIYHSNDYQSLNFVLKFFIRNFFKKIRDDIGLVIFQKSIETLVYFTISMFVLMIVTQGLNSILINIGVLGKLRASMNSFVLTSQAVKL